MTVWVAVRQDYEGDEILGVFDSEAAADLRVASEREQWPEYSYEVMRFEVQSS